MANKATKQQLDTNAAAQQAVAGGLLPEVRTLILADGVPRKMQWNFRALAAIEHLERQDPKAGGLMKLAQFAFALTASHRNAAGDDVTFDAFVDAMPADPDGLAQVTERVYACLPASMKAADEGNVEGPVSTPALADAAPAESSEG